MSLNLSQKRCVACEGGALPMSLEEARKMMAALNPEWKLQGGEIKRKFEFKDFKEAMIFVNRVAEIAEIENHHPEIEIEYNKVELELKTHAINGLSENDFILAAKIDSIQTI